MVIWNRGSSGECTPQSTINKPQTHELESCQVAGHRSWLAGDRILRSCRIVRYCTASSKSILFLPRHQLNCKCLVLWVHHLFFVSSPITQMKHISKIKRKIFPKSSKRPVSLGTPASAVAGLPGLQPEQNVGSEGGPNLSYHDLVIDRP